MRTHKVLNWNRFQIFDLYGCERFNLRVLGETKRGMLSIDYMEKLFQSFDEALKYFSFYDVLLIDVFHFLAYSKQLDRIFYVVIKYARSNFKQLSIWQKTTFLKFQIMPLYYFYCAFFADSARVKGSCRCFNVYRQNKIKVVSSNYKTPEGCFFLIKSFSLLKIRVKIITLTVEK